MQDRTNITPSKKKRVPSIPQPKSTIGIRDSVRMIKMKLKLNNDDYDYEQIENKDCDNDEMSDVLSKCNEIDNHDKKSLIPRLSNFDKMVEEIREFRKIEE